jgi:hypothetical protein
MIETDTDFCWMCSSSLTSVDVRDFCTTKTYSDFVLTNICWNTHRQSRDEKQHDYGNIIESQKTPISSVLLLQVSLSGDICNSED